MNPAAAYILNQPEPYRSILLQLQTIIEAVDPDLELLYKWRIPYYYSNGIPLCYLNKSKDFVDLGFWHHDKMERYQHYFVATNRKHIRSLRYTAVDDINSDVIVYVIQKQLELNINPFKMIRQ